MKVLSTPVFSTPILFSVPHSSMQSQLLLASFKHRPKNSHHGGQGLTADTFFYGFGVLAALSATCLNVCGPGTVGHHLHERNQVQAASGLQASNAARQALTPAGGQTALPTASHSAWQAQPKQTPVVRSTFRRKITSHTSLRSMHVTKAMAESLGLHWQLSGEGVGGSESAGKADSRPGGENASAWLRDDRYPVFRHAMTLQDTKGYIWPVLYEAVMSGCQYHRRLSDGWRAFCRHHGVSLNDTIEFRRCGTSIGDLAVRVVRRGRNAS